MAAVLPSTTVRARLTPIALATRAPIRLVSQRIVDAPPAERPEYAEPPTTKPPTDLSEKPPEEETPWLLYGSIAAAVAVVGGVIYWKKFRKGR